MSKYSFYSHYQGPLGSHLDCLTHYTKTHTVLDSKFEKSIHPYGRYGFVPRKAKSKATLHRAIDGISGHLERHPNDLMSVARKASFEARLAAR